MRALRGLPPLETALALCAFVVLVMISVATENRKPQLRTDTYSSFDASGGGYRAWYELLSHEGIAATRFERRPAFLDDSTATLIWAQPLSFAPASSNAPEVGPADAEAIARWVRDGGQLIALGAGDASEALTRELHLHRAAAHARSDRRPFVDPSIRVLGIRHVDAPGNLRFERTGGSSVVLADRHGPLVLWRSLGHGDVIELSEQAIFSNENIANPDRARLAFALATMPGARLGQIAFDESEHGYFVPEHWWEVLPRALLWSLGLTAAAVAIAVVGSAIRLGPPLAPPARREPTSSEYIDALAALYEHAGASGKALGDAYASARLAATRAFGLSTELPDREIAAALPEPARVQLAELGSLARGRTPNPATLVRAVRLAYRVRREFDRVRP